ncbi:hypothetical protein NDU88_006492 [Pleurodeles waltl]|uniref:Uncharacterized protein n=1 Tax=Pleurodeles waltl TaxID=8319 RepID=A0AAV7PQU8_PLEWA|nr:hypothetical protein NDU88_006492 [Pleurodeles waltl]
MVRAQRYLGLRPNEAGGRSPFTSVGGALGEGVPVPLRSGGVLAGSPVAMGARAAAKRCSRSLEGDEARRDRLLPGGELSVRPGITPPKSYPNIRNRDFRVRYYRIVAQSSPKASGVRDCKSRD